MEYNKVKITNEESLESLEEVLKKYNETLFATSGEYKQFSKGMESIQKAWSKALDEDRLKIIACLDLCKQIKW